MTKYVVDDARQEIIATWETGIGGQARLVARLPQAASPDPNLPLGAALADWLGRLSDAAWRRYTGDDLEADEFDSGGSADETDHGTEISDVLVRISDPGRLASQVVRSAALVCREDRELPPRGRFG